MAQTTNTELEKKLLQKDLQIEKLERDRRWLADREKEEREEKDREREAHDEDKASVHRDPNSLTDQYI